MENATNAANLPAIPLVNAKELEARVNNQEILEAWLGGRNPRTLMAYRKDIEDFGRFLGGLKGTAAVDALLSMSQGAANGVVLNYRNDMITRGLAPATVARRLAALRSLIKLARMLGRVSWSIDIESPQAERLRDTTGPGLDGWRAILGLSQKLAQSRKPLHIRDLALIRLLHDLGLRRGEVSDLDIKSYDRESGRLSVLGKGRLQTEPLTLPPPCRRDLEAWLVARGNLSGPLFIRLDHGSLDSMEQQGKLTPLGGEAIRKIVARLAKKAGITKTVRPHGLRHQAITSVLDRNGGDVRAAARFSRHKDINTLTKYDDNRRDLGGAMANLISEDAHISLP